MNARSSIWAAFLLMVACTVSAQQPAIVNEVIGELRSGHAESALSAANSALKLTPNNVILWTLRGLAAKQLSQTSLAIHSFKAALKIDPDYLPALEGICELLYAQTSDELPPYLARLLAKLPDDPNANGMAGILDYRAGKFAEAVGEFNKAGAAIADKMDAMSAYADTLVRLRRDDEARSLLGTIVQRWPEDTRARYNLAILQSRKGENELALKTLQPLVAANDESALSLAASLHESSGDTPAAVELLRSAIATNPKNPQNYIDFGALSFDHSSVSAGIAILNAGIAQLPYSAALYIARGVLYMQTSEVKAAEDDFARANQLDPTQSFGFEAQSLSEIQRHNLPAALQKVKSSLAKAPNNAYLNYMAAEILKEQGVVPGSRESAQALAYARRAVDLDSSLIGAHNLLGALAFAAGDLPEALNASRATLNLDSTNQEALFRLILILRRTGDLQHEVPALVGRLKLLRANEHNGQRKVDRYRLFESEADTP